jgi:hypothetical protein
MLRSWNMYRSRLRHQPEPLPPPPDGSETDFFAGLDLGQLSTYSALAVLERTTVTETEPLPANLATCPGMVPPKPKTKRTRHYALRELRRWPLRTPYPDIVGDVVRWYAGDSPLAGSSLVVDRTGVGVAVYGDLRRAKPNCPLVPATIHGGSKTSVDEEDGCWSVPKRELAGVVQTLLGTRRLQCSPKLPLAKVLMQELTTFTVKININSGSESFEAWRARDFDDCVLALALGLWYSEHAQREVWWK